MVRTINTLSNPVTVASELPLKLARKYVDVFGYAAFDEEQAVHTLNPGCDDEIVTVAAGKEFALLKTVSSKVNSKQLLSMAKQKIVFKREMYLALYVKGAV